MCETYKLLIAYFVNFMFDVVLYFMFYICVETNFVNFEEFFSLMTFVLTS